MDISEAIFHFRNFFSHQGYFAVVYIQRLTVYRSPEGNLLN